MNDIVIFGASQEGAFALEYLREHYNVVAFCDNDHRRWGTSYYDVPVISVDTLKYAFDKSTVVIANARYEKILIFQLWELGVRTAYIFGIANGIYQLRPVDFPDERVRFCSVIDEVCDKIKNTRELDIYEHAHLYHTDKSRVFFFTIYDNAGECGGPQGVMHRLQLANQKYKLLANDFYIFGDRVVTPKSCIKKTTPITRKYNSLSIADAVHSLWGRYTDKAFRLHHFDALVDRLALLQSRFEQLCSLHELYGFSDDDIYIFHDVEISFVFNSLFTVTKQALVYHNQGGLYYEYISFSGKSGEGLSLSWYMMHKYCLALSRYHVFPSMGGFDALQQTCPELLDDIGLPTIIHNGCKLDRVSVSDSIKNRIDSFIHQDTLLFVTVAMVNDAKAIDRIPVFLAKIKQSGIGNLQWILIGDGPCRDKLDTALSQNGLSDSILWITDRLPHSDIQYILSRCMFYIILQKYSICDFATIESMGRGCIPVLSNVPGNLPYLAHSNGVAIADHNDSSLFLSFLKNKNLEEFRNKNISVQRSFFSDFSFLTGYHNLIINLDES